MLARVRVEARDGEPRPGEAEARKLARGEPDRLLHHLAREQARHVGEGDVHRREHDAKLVGIKHHRDMRSARQVRQQVGVAVPGQAGQPERFLC